MSATALLCLLTAVLCVLVAIAFYFGGWYWGVAVAIVCGYLEYFLVRMYIKAPGVMEKGWSQVTLTD